MFDHSSISIKGISINCYYIRTHLLQIKCISVTGSRLKSSSFISFLLHHVVIMTANCESYEWKRIPDYWSPVNAFWQLLEYLRNPCKRPCYEATEIYVRGLRGFCNDVVPRAADKQLNEDDLMFYWSSAASFGHAFIDLIFLLLFHRTPSRKILELVRYVWGLLVKKKEMEMSTSISFLCTSRCDISRAAH